MIHHGTRVMNTLRVFDRVFLELDKRRDRRAMLSEPERKREIERERERDRERPYGNLGGPTTPNQEPCQPLHAPL